MSTKGPGSGCKPIANLRLGNSFLCRPRLGNGCLGWQPADDRLQSAHWSAIYVFMRDRPTREPLPHLEAIRVRYNRYFSDAMRVRSATTSVTVSTKTAARKVNS